MISLITSNGDMFEIQWIGVSNIDGVLRFAVINSDVTSVINTFTKPENCEVLTRSFDGEEITYNGYTIFRGIQINYDGSIVTSLSKI